MCNRIIIISLATMVFAGLSLAESPPKTFCNPLNLDYGFRDVKGVWSRHGADPVIVLFKDRYYLFSTWELPGYRVSDDLVNWKAIPFAAPDELVGQQYTAAAVKQIGDWLYYTEFGKESRPVAMYRTQDPDSGKWEKCSELLPPYADPCLFVDPPSGKVYMYSGLEKPIFGVELDPKNGFKEVGRDKNAVDAGGRSKGQDRGWVGNLHVGQQRDEQRNARQRRVRVVPRGIVDDLPRW